MNLEPRIERELWVSEHIFLPLFPSLTLSVSSHDFSSLSGSAPGVHPLRPESPCIGINMTIPNLLHMFLHRTPSATKWHPFQYPRWENVTDPIWLDVCHWTIKLYRGVSSTDQSYEKWTHLSETVLDLPSRLYSPVFPKSLPEDKNHLGYLYTASKVPKQIWLITIATMALGCTWEPPRELSSYWCLDPTPSFW